MWSNTDRAVVYGALAFIAYQLYKQTPAMGDTIAGCVPPESLTIVPGWVQQFSNYTVGEDYFTPRCGIFGRCA